MNKRPCFYVDLHDAFFIHVHVFFCSCFQFVHEEALAYELAAYFYLDLGEINKSVDYFLLAHTRYQEWVSCKIAFFHLCVIIITLSLLLICIGSSSNSLKGAMGKCNSLFKFVDGIIKEHLGASRPTIDSLG